VKLDADNDSSGGPPHPKGNPWGPSALGLYCTGDPPPTGAPGPHPYLDCDVLPAREQTPWPFPAPAAKGKTLEFEAWQAQQFDETLQVPANTVVGRILAGWNMCVRVVRVIKEIFSRNPRVSMIRLRARACGYKPTGRTRNVTGNLEATLEVFPSDSFEFSVTTSAFAGLDYSREVVRSDASNPVAETGQAQYDSSGSKDQVEDTESFTMRSAFGAVKDTHSVTKIEGTGGGADKSLVIIEDVKQRGFTTDIHRATDASHDNTFQGEAYTLDFNQTKQTDISGVKTGGSLSFSETGKMVDRTDETGAIRDNDDYRADGDFQSGSFDYTGADRAGTDRVTRVPPYPSTFFPLCPVDISFKRNDLEDEFTQHAKSVVGNLIFISRNMAAFAGRLSNWVPSMGFGFNFSFDILSGNFKYYKQHREHIDRRVYVYSKGTLDITCFQTSLTLWGGAWFELLMLEFKAVVEIILSGKVGVKGELESTHPDATVRGNVGFGPTGGVGAKVQIRIVVGQADWCSAAVGIRTGIEMIAWTQHQEGPHVRWDATFTGVTAFITARLALVGGWEYERKFCQEKKIAERRWPDVTDGDILERQNAEMESLTQEAILEAQEMSTKSEASRLKNRASVRSKP
jgi:hypothetical protein